MRRKGQRKAGEVRRKEQKKAGRGEKEGTEEGREGNEAPSVRRQGLNGKSRVQRFVPVAE